MTEPIDKCEKCGCEGAQGIEVAGGLCQTCGETEPPKPCGTRVDLVYTDGEGNKLYGFSQTQLDRLDKTLRLLIIILTTVALVAFSIGGYLLYWVVQHHYLTRLLEALL